MRGLKTAQRNKATIPIQRATCLVTLPQIPLGTVVAERHFILWDSESSKHEIVVKLGAPVQIDTGSGPLFRCPAQILGLGVDQIVYAPAGEDAFIALCNALDLIGQVLEESKSLNLQNRYKSGQTGSPAWVWQYMDQPREQTSDCSDTAKGGLPRHS